MTAEVNIQRDMTRLVVGVAIILAGLLFTLDNLNLIHAGSYLKYWPVFLVAFGVVKLVQSKSWGSYGWSVVSIVVGLWWLGENIGLISVSVFALWPLLLVLVGASIIWRVCCPPEVHASGQTHRKVPPDPFGARIADELSDGPVDEATGKANWMAGASADATTRSASRSPDSIVRAVAFLSGVERASTSADFRGGDLVAFMGGCELDLRQAAIAGDEAVIDVTAIMGGVEIKIPENWTVDARVFPIMGGVGDETRPVRNTSSRRLVIRGVALMGGVHVKN